MRLHLRSRLTLALSAAACLAAATYCGVLIIEALTVGAVRHRGHAILIEARPATFWVQVVLLGASVVASGAMAAACLYGLVAMRGENSRLDAYLAKRRAELAPEREGPN